jgi:hypothetical protein
MMMSVKRESREAVRGGEDIDWAEALARALFLEAIDPNSVPLPAPVRERVCEVVRRLEAQPALEAMTECFRMLG